MAQETDERLVNVLSQTFCVR